MKSGAKFKIAAHHFWNTNKPDGPPENYYYFIGEVMDPEPNRAGQIYVSITGSPQYVYNNQCVEISEDEFIRMAEEKRSRLKRSVVNKRN